MVHDEVKFNITQMDSLGQGVSKEGGIVFIEKVLPGEKGTGVVYREAKGVRFAVLKSVEKQSVLRKDPDCPLFSSCYGCQYLHVSYKDEMNFKYLVLQKQFEKLLKNNFTPEIYPSPKRYGYRNRIQLHYDKKDRKLGFISKASTEIIPADRCLLPVEPVAREIKKLYESENWLKILPETSSERGTIELYRKDGKVNINVNKPYSNGEFTQINGEMNEVLKDLVTEAYVRSFKGVEEPVVLDIFGGRGNLTSKFSGARVVVLDIKPGTVENAGRSSSAVFIKHDLYGKDSVLKCKTKLQRSKVPMPDLLVFDPPRKGVKNIAKWVSQFNPEYIFYVSCNPATLHRDTVAIKDRYEITSINLVDMFPGTKHFETFAVFRKLNKGE